MNNCASSPGNLDGLIAVVTGGVQGLGLGITEQLARYGATAIIADLQLDKGRTEAARLQADGLKVHAAYLDITDSAWVTTFFDDVIGKHERLDILVNNAGVGQNVAPDV